MPDFARAPWLILVMRLCFGVLLAIVTVLSLISSPDDVPGGPAFSRWIAGLLLGSSDHADKVSHFIAYAALGGTAMLAALRPFGHRWTLPVMLFAYSGLIELMQAAGGVRHGDIADMLANGMGLAAGIVLAALTLMLNDRLQEGSVA